MKCPNCEHVSETALLQCGECGETYDRHTLEEHQHLAYLVDWLEAQDASIGVAALDRLREGAREKLQASRAKLLPFPPAPKAPALALSPEEQLQLAYLVAARKRVLQWFQDMHISPDSARKLREALLAQALELDPGVTETQAGIELPPVDEAAITTFVRSQLGAWRANGWIDRLDHDRLINALGLGQVVAVAPEAARLSPDELKHAALLLAARKRAPEWASFIQTFEVYRLIEDLSDRLSRYAVPQNHTLPEVRDEAITAFISEELLPAWQSDFLLTDTSTHLLEDYLKSGPTAEEPEPVEPVFPVEVKAPLPEPAAPVARPPAPEPAPAPLPKAPPKPREPLIRWDKLWEKVVEATVSGLLVRWLRYFAAFTIVVSLAVVVLNYWNQIPQWGQVTIIFFVPAAFFGGGFFARQRLKLVQTGSVLMGIGQLLFAVDFAAIYQFGGLTVELPLYWLVTSVICTLIYVFTVWRLVQDEFFGYIALAGLGSTVAALLAVTTRTLDWPLVSLAAFSLLSIEAGHRLSSGPEKWHAVGGSARRFPQFILPVALTLILFFPAARFSLSLPLAFLIGLAAFTLLAVRFSHLIYTHIAIWFGLVTTGVVLWSLQVPWHWFATAAALLSPVYVITHEQMSRRVPKAFPARSAHFLAFRLAGFGTLLLAILLGAATAAWELWPAVIALALAALSLGVYAVLLRRPVLVLAAAGLFVLPFSLASYRLFDDAAQPGIWLMAAWPVLSLAYLAVSVRLRRLARYSRWLALAALLLPPFALIGLGAHLLLDGLGNFTPTLAALAASLVYYLSADLLLARWRFAPLAVWVRSAVPTRQVRPSVFLYPIGVLLPAALAVAWNGLGLDGAMLGAGMAVLAVAYIGIGLWAGRLGVVRRFPFHLLAYPLGMMAVLVALPSKSSLAVALYILVLGLGLMAWVYRRFYESAAAAVLFLAPFQLTLDLLGVLPEVHSLAFLLLAGLVYIPAGLLLRRKAAPEGHHLIIWLLGYGLSLYALAAVLLGTQLPWVQVLVPFLAAGLYIASAYLVRGEFTWAAGAVLPLAFYQVLDVFALPVPWHALAWVVLGAGYLLLTLTPLNKTHPGGVSWRRVLQVGAWTLVGFGIAQTAPATAFAFILGRTSEMVFPPVAAQLAAAAFTLLAGWRFRSRWPLFLSPWLIFTALTLSFIGYGMTWFGGELAAFRYGEVWAGLAALLTLAAVAFDQATGAPARKSSYLHGIYLGALLILALGVVWSLGSQAAFLWTMGIGVLLTAGLAVLVHRGRMPAWDQAVSLLNLDPSGVRARFLHSFFIWPPAFALPIWLAVFVDMLGVLPGYNWLALTAAGLGLLLLAFRLRWVDPAYTWPLHAAGHAATGFALIMSAPQTLRILAGRYALPVEIHPALPLILIQATAVLYFILSARAFRTRGSGYVYPYLAAFLSFFPYTLTVITFGALLSGRPVAGPEFGIAWMLLAGLAWGTGIFLDGRRPTQVSPSQAAGEPRAGRRWESFRAHGLHLFAYGLAMFSLTWAFIQWRPQTQPALLWTFGLWLALMALSAWANHAGKHPTWRELVVNIFIEAPVLVRPFSGSFFWLTAWALPVWVIIFLWQLGVTSGFGYLAYTGAALAYLLLAYRMKDGSRGYGWALVSAGQFFTALALIQMLQVSVPVLAWWPSGAAIVKNAPNLLAGAVVVKAVAVAYYGLAALYFRDWKLAARGFTLAASVLALAAYAAGWIGLVFTGPDPRLGYPMTAFSALLLLAGFLLDAVERRAASDGRRVGFAHGVYLLGYLLAGYMVSWTSGSRPVHLVVFGAALAMAALSQVARHFKRHETWEDFTAFMCRGAPEIVWKVIGNGFLWLAAFSFPFWMETLLAQFDVPWAWRGAGLALAAPLYIAGGLALRRLDRAYAWPLYIAGYLLTAVGAWISLDNQLLSIYVLSLNVVVYAASAYIFKRSIWLYLSTMLAPVIALMVLDYNLSTWPAAWVAGTFMGMSFFYFAAGQVFDRLKQIGRIPGGYAMPFYVPAYLLSAIALVMGSGQKELAIAVYMAGALLYALSAWRFKQTIFLYPAVWLPAVPYYLGLTYTRLEPDWYGIGLLPLILAAVLAGRFIFHRRRPRLSYSHPALPFYLLGYTLSLVMLLIARADLTALAAGLGAAALLYLGSGWLFRLAWWLYPGLLALHLALLTFAAADPTLPFNRYLSALFMPLTYLTGLAGAAAWKKRAVQNLRPSEILRSWALPLLVFAVLDVLVWQIVSLSGYDTAIGIAGGHAVLLAIVAAMWASQPLVWGAMGFFSLGLGLRLLWTGEPLFVLGAVAAGAGLVLYLLGRLVEVLADSEGLPSRKVLALWRLPLVRTGLGINAAGLLLTLPFVFQDLSMASLALAFSGALYLAVAYRGRYHRLGYAAVAMLELSLVLLLLFWEIRQPQWFALPVGLYLIFVGVFERRRGRSHFPLILESLGLAVILLTSFMQSLDRDVGFWFFIVLMMEGFAAMAWAAQQRRKTPFLIGLGANVVNVLGQIALVFMGGSSITRWIISIGVAVVLLMATMFAERWIIPRAQELRERLEGWA